MIFVTLKADRGGYKESTFQVACHEMKQDPLFPDRVILHLAQPLVLRAKGSPAPAKRWSVMKLDIGDWFQLDKDESDRIAREAAAASLAAKAVSEPAPVAATPSRGRSESAPEPVNASSAAASPSKPSALRSEAVVPRISTGGINLNLTIDLDDDDEDDDE